MIFSAQPRGVQHSIESPRERCSIYQYASAVQRESASAPPIRPVDFLSLREVLHLFGEETNEEKKEKDSLARFSKKKRKKKRKLKVNLLLVTNH